MNAKNISVEQVKVLSDIYQTFDKVEYGNSAWWIKWKKSDNNLINWNENTWQGVLDGSLADQIFELLKPFAEVAEKNIDKLEF